MGGDESNCICRAHSGFEARIKAREKDDSAQWKEINGMKKFIVGVLASSVLTLLVVVINLVMALAKG